MTESERLAKLEANIEILNYKLDVLYQLCGTKFGIEAVLAAQDALERNEGVGESEVKMMGTIEKKANVQKDLDHDAEGNQL